MPEVVALTVSVWELLINVPAHRFSVMLFVLHSHRRALSSLWSLVMMSHLMLLNVFALKTEKLLSATLLLMMKLIIGVFLQGKNQRDLKSFLFLFYSFKLPWQQTDILRRRSYLHSSLHASAIWWSFEKQFT